LDTLEDRTLPSAYVVTTTADSGAGSLRDAITQINADTSHTLYPSPTNPSVDEIDFAITAASDTGGGYNSGTGVATIKPQSALPQITNAVFINGFASPSQENTLPLKGSSAGDNANRNIALDGSNIGSSDGLTIAAGNSTVQGLVIQNLTNNGIHLTTNGNDVIAGNWITNTGQGVFVDNVANNTVGGTTPGARNVLAAVGNGVVIQGTGASNNYVQGNYIGTDGTHFFLDRVSEGIEVDDGSFNHVGGAAPEAGNVIDSGSLGILLFANNGSSIQGNYIGTTADGTAIPTSLGGIVSHRSGIIGGSNINTTIGGLDTNAPGQPLSGGGNLISETVCKTCNARVSRWF
jgi:hypothetical protein